MNEPPASALALYHERDKELFNQLKMYLASLRRTGRIDDSRVDLPPGLDEPQVHEWVDGSDVIILLLTQAIVSIFEQLPAVAHALHRWQAGQVVLIPVLARPVKLEGTPLANVRCLPSNGKSIAQWSDPDLAWVDVIEGIERALTKPQKPTPSGGGGGGTKGSQSIGQGSASYVQQTFRFGHALFIGVGGDLPATVLDATALAELFTDPLRAAYPKDQVTLLTGTNAGRRGVLDALDRLIERVDAAPEPATVVFYYSGHGVRIRHDEQDTYYLVPDGYDPNRPAETAISGEELSRRLGKLMRHKLLVLLDCCHAAAFPKSEGSVANNAAFPQDLIERLREGTGQIIIASSMDHEVSLTGDPHSIFTSCLLEALSGRGARGPEGYARIFDVAAYLLETVSKRARGVQHPVVKRMENITENFAICAYPRGITADANGPFLPKSTPQTGSDLIAQLAQRRRELELKACMKRWELITDKIAKFTRELDISASPPLRYELEIRLKESKETLAEVEQMLAKLAATG